MLIMIDMYQLKIIKKQKYNPKNIYKTSMFNVVDMGFNSIFLKANKDLLELLKNII